MKIFNLETHSMKKIFLITSISLLSIQTCFTATPILQEETVNRPLAQVTPPKEQTLNDRLNEKFKSDLEKDPLKSVYAVGVQVYKCIKGVWVHQYPLASLYAMEDGKRTEKLVGHHSACKTNGKYVPNWNVGGTAIQKKENVDAEKFPSTTTGQAANLIVPTIVYPSNSKSELARTSNIVRKVIKGGAPESDTCENEGEIKEFPYEATYGFYKKIEDGYNYNNPNLEGRGQDIRSY